MELLHLDLEAAGWWQRVAAYLIDTVAAVALGAAATFAVVLARILAGASEPDAVRWGLIAFGTGYVNYAPLLMRRQGVRNGQTLGKQALRIRVTRLDGSEIAWGRALAREVVGKGALGFVPLLPLIDVLLPLFDRRSQALHDKLARTLVLHAQPVIEHGNRPTPAPGPTRSSFSPRRLLFIVLAVVAVAGVAWVAAAIQIRSAEPDAAMIRAANAPVVQPCDVPKQRRLAIHRLVRRLCESGAIDMAVAVEPLPGYVAAYKLDGQRGWVAQKRARGGRAELTWDVPARAELSAAIAREAAKLGFER
jgi:uncharacterized RDD family membrane protein YckC